MIRKKTIGNLMAFIALILWIYGCSPSQKKQHFGDKSVPVKVATAAQKNVPIQMDAMGWVSALQTVSIKSQITAQIEKVCFVEGQEVKKGDLLFELDCRTYEAALRQAEANLLRDTAQAQYAAEQARRYADLVKKEYVAQEQYDQIRSSANALDATLKADKAVIDNNRVQMQYCSIYSPLNGRTGMLKVHQGNIARANDTELLTIHQIQPIDVVFAIPEKDLPRVRTYFEQKQLEVDAFIPGEKIPERGVLSFIDNGVDTATGTITLKGSFANEQKRLVPGQYVNVLLQLTIEPHVVVVPTQCLEQGPEGEHVYVVKPDSTAEMRPVVTGEDIGDETVILKGISVGEQVVADGQLQLTPGAKVSIKDETAITQAGKAGAKFKNEKQKIR